MQTFQPSLIPASFTPGSPISSDLLNQIVNALNGNMSLLKSILNDQVYPVLASLPNGPRLVTLEEQTGDVDPTANGLDGSQLYLLNTATAATPNYYDEVEGRPLTVFEVIDWLINHNEVALAEIKGIANKTALSSSVYNNMIIGGYPIRTSRTTIQTQASGHFWIKLEEDPTVFGQYTYSGTMYSTSNGSEVNPAVTREVFRVVYDNGLTGSNNVHLEYKDKRFMYADGEWVLWLGNGSDSDFISGSSSTYGSHDWTTILGTDKIKVMRIVQ